LVLCIVTPPPPSHTPSHLHLQAHHPIGQWMYECATCGQAVCLVCRDACHAYCAWDAAAAFPSATAALKSAPSVASLTAPAAAAASSTVAVPAPRQRHVLRPLGFLPAVSCACLKSSCRAIGAIDPREAAGGVMGLRGIPCIAPHAPADRLARCDPRPHPLSSASCPRPAGFVWVPNPIDTRGASGLNMAAGSELGELVDKLAWNSHEVRGGGSSG
jgi:hypothetical protein